MSYNHKKKSQKQAPGTPPKAGLEPSRYHQPRATWWALVWCPGFEPRALACHAKKCTTGPPVWWWKCLYIYGLSTNPVNHVDPSKTAPVWNFFVYSRLSFARKCNQWRKLSAWNLCQSFVSKNLLIFVPYAWRRSRPWVTEVLRTVGIALCANHQIPAMPRTIYQGNMQRMQQWEAVRAYFEKKKASQESVGCCENIILTYPAGYPLQPLAG